MPHPIASQRLIDSAIATAIAALSVLCVKLTGNQTIAGDKTFSGTLAASGNVTVAGNLSTSVQSLAAAGANQGAAGAITKDIVVVTAADDAKGVRLPVSAAAGGLRLFVKNTVAAKNLLIYPAAGAKIDGGSDNAALTVAGGKSVLLVSVSATEWYSLLTA